MAVPAVDSHVALQIVPSLVDEIGAGTAHSALPVLVAWLASLSRFGVGCPGGSLVLEHDLLFDGVDVFLACTHALHEGVVLLLQILALFIDLIIFERQLHQLSLRLPLRFLSSECLRLVLLDALLELLGLGLVSTILLVRVTHLTDVALAFIFKLLDQRLYLVFVLIQSILQQVLLLAGFCQVVLEPLQSKALFL